MISLNCKDLSAQTKKRKKKSTAVTLKQCKTMFKGKALNWSKNSYWVYWLPIYWFLFT